MPDYSARLRAAQQRMAEHGVDLLFLPRCERAIPARPPTQPRAR
jgi:hypothetical protein